MNAVGRLPAVARPALAASGLILVVFVLAHLAGVVLAAINPAVFEAYATALHAKPWLPVVEWALAVVAVLHLALTAAVATAQPAPPASRHRIRRPRGWWCPAESSPRGARMKWVKHMTGTRRDEYLRKFYYEFMVSEAGHYRMFIDLAKHYLPAEQVKQRWEEMLVAEAEIMGQLELRGDRVH
mgnify:CR=1 FL=1